MNERIKELAKQACITIVPEPFDDASRAWNDTMEKFAELIVQECLTKIENEAAQYAEPVWAFELVNDIKEHFGVE
jgi:predicted metal-dependent phosphoesterase TrpH